MKVIFLPIDDKAFMQTRDMLSEQSTLPLFKRNLFSEMTINRWPVKWLVVHNCLDEREYYI